MENKTEITFEQLNEIQKAAFNAGLQMPAYKPGRSIVSSCYRQEITGTYILLKELQRLGFTLPIEIFYREGELAQDEIDELSKIYSPNTTFKKLNTQFENFKDRWGNEKGWATKVYAILESEYAENMWIDGDNYPIRNCEDLFEDAEYKEKGSLFWRDVYSVDRADQYFSGSVMWKVFGIPYNDGEPFESGQFLVNKPAVWKQLTMMKYFTDNSQIYFNFGGDAECWRMAWQWVAVNTNGYHTQFNYQQSNAVPYGFMPYGPFHKGEQNVWHKYGGGTVMVQRDRKGHELFNHRNINKFNVNNQNTFNDDIQNESSYHMILRHMEVKYNIKK